jgi:lipopolysaccharide transport system ATP-binding protein
MKPSIEVQNLSKQFRLGEIQGYKTIRETMQNIFKHRRKKQDVDYIWALRNISFNVQQGEVLGIIGRNGAGKTTLLKILSRITEPTEGIAKLRGRVASLLEVGTGFHPELTGRENIFLNGALLGMRKSEIKVKFDEIIAFSEIEKFLDTPVKRYSSGMYVRLAFAVAAHLEPEILIVDEVLAVGDVQFQKKCLGKMKEVSKREGRTVLFVSHNMSAISSLCTKGMLLVNGKLAYSGTARDTVKEYLEGIEDSKNKKMEWLAPKRKYPFANVVRINRFYVMDEDGNIPIGRLFNSKQYNVVIESDLLQSDGRLIFIVAYYGEDGTLLFTTDIHDTGEISFDKVSPGQLKLSVPVPVGLLANKSYEIELWCALHYVGWVLPPDSESRMRFEFFRDVDLNPYSNNETRLGALAPVLKWKLL